MSHDVPAHVARLRTLEAAEKRRRMGAVMGGPRRLGGAVPTRNLSPRELAAAVRMVRPLSMDFAEHLCESSQAAERRTRDELSCASGAEAQREAEKAAAESAPSEVIDLTTDTDSDIVILDEPLSSGVMAKVATRMPRAPVRTPPAARTPMKGSLPGSRRSYSRVRPPKVATPPPSGAATPTTSRASPLPMDNDPWVCPRCTLENEPRTLQCVACLLIRPESPAMTPAASPRLGAATPKGWTCPQCGETGMEHQFWSCRFCGAVKTQSVFG